MFTEKRSVPLDWPSVFIYLFLIQLSALALSTADWTDHLDIVTVSTFLALVLGAALARSRFRGWAAALFSTSYAIFFIGVQIGRTMSEGLLWQDRIRSLLGRLEVFFSVILQGETNEDPLMFVLLMAAVFWILASSGTWMFFRKGRLWWAVLPAGAGLIVNSYFYVGRAPMGAYTATYIMLLLVLVARTDILSRIDMWKRIRAQVPVEAGTYVSVVGLGIALMLVVSAWGGPAFVRSEAAADLWRSVSRPVRRVRDRIGEAFGDLRSPVTLVYDAYGDELTLDSGSEPLDEIVMEIEAEEDPSRSGRFYWRNRTYAVYEDGLWSSTPGELIEVRARDDDLKVAEYEAREELMVNVLPKQKAVRVLSLPSQPVYFSRDAEVLVTMEGDYVVDIAMVEAEDLVYNGDVVRAAASVAVPTADDLREAGTEYPDWVLESYLQMPDVLSERTLALAEEITQPYDNSYDRVMAVTTWLRSNIEYQRVIAAPEELTDRLDWFLFESQVGFCNWYASAEVILLRSVGIPARLAVGYASGSHDPVEQLYVVSSTDSHAWPEVFFPGIGWVEFEPTGNQPSLVRPEDPARMAESDYRDTPWVRMAQEEMFGDGLEESADSPELPEEDLDLPVFSTGFKFSLRVYLALGVVLAVLMYLWLKMDPLARIAAAGVLAAGLRWAGVNPPKRLEEVGELALTTAGIMYARWSRWMERLEFNVMPSQTPYERALLFANRFPEYGSAGWQIARTYTLERYAGVFGDIWETRKAWHRLRLRLFKIHLINKTAGIPASIRSSLRRAARD